MLKFQLFWALLSTLLKLKLLLTLSEVPDSTYADFFLFLSFFFLSFIILSSCFFLSSFSHTFLLCVCVCVCVCSLYSACCVGTTLNRLSTLSGLETVACRKLRYAELTRFS